MENKSKLLEPIEIKGMKIKNRLGFAPMQNQPVSKEFGVGDNTIRWFDERAKGGVGLQLIGAVLVSKYFFDLTLPMREAMNASGGISIFDDKFIPGYARLAKAMRAYDCRIGAQLAFPGPMGMHGPSWPPYPTEEDPKIDLMELELDMKMPVTVIDKRQIEQFQNDFIDGAKRAKEAGLDFVELHAAHGSATLPSSFMSPYYNRRTDEYGGSWENRLRFAVETIEGMRKAVGDDYPIFIRLSIEEFLGNRGITLEDSIKHVIPAMEKAGVDCIDVSFGSMTYSSDSVIQPGYYPRGCFMYVSEAVKKATDLPVIGVGRILDLDFAEECLEEGKADIIYIGRQLIADPETPKKYFDGRPEDIRKCIGDCPARGECEPCTINYEAFREGQILITKADKPKKVFIAGGGVAGMEAARIAATRGHKVILCEKESELGGMVRSLSKDSLLADFGNIVEYLAVCMKKLGVDVITNNEATSEIIKEHNPDVVICATGSTMSIPNEVQGKHGVMNHIEALNKKDELGQRVVIRGLGYGCELALSLAKEGRDVTLIGKGSKIAAGIPSLRRFWLLRRLSDINIAEAKKLYNPRVITDVELIDFVEDGVVIADKSGEKSVLPADTLIISMGRKKNSSLYESLKDQVPELYHIGDCVGASTIQYAIYSANDVARKI